MTPPVDPERTLSPGGKTITSRLAPETQFGNQDVPPSCAWGPFPRTTIAGYEIREEIARGGMGAVLSARELALDREVALKVLLPEATGAAAQFVQEARITARLPHPGVPPIYALGQLPDGRPFLAMKLIRGHTLAHILATRGRRNTSPHSDPDLTAPCAPGLLQVFEQLCQTVAFAHAHGVVHRDLKPGNVMVGAFGEVQVMDWGLAKLVNRHVKADSGEDTVPGGTPDTLAAGDVTLLGAVVGTPAYMPPEQARGEHTDERSDVFALGGVLCAILTGHPPFAGRDPADTLRLAAAGNTARAFDRLNRCHADAELVTLAKRCLSLNPRNRPPDAGALAVEVAAYRAGAEERMLSAESSQTVPVLPPAPPEPPRPPARRRWTPQRAKAALLLAASLSVGLLWWADRNRLRCDANRRVAEAYRQALGQQAADGCTPEPAGQ